MSNYRSKEIMDAIVYVGMNRMMCLQSTINEINDDINESEKYLDELIRSSGVEIGHDIDRGIKSLEKEIDAAVEIMKGEISLDLDEEIARENQYIFFSLDEELDDMNESSDLYPYLMISQAFNSLDSLVYLVTAVHDLDEINFPDHIKELLHDKINAIHKKIVMDMDLSYWRLIPLNTIRNMMLSCISKEEHYLFPWYYEGAEMPEEALSIIIDKLLGEGLIETPFSHGDFNMLVSMILANDAALVRLIKDKVEFFKLLPLAIDQAYAFRWMVAADKMAGGHRLSKKVCELGLVNTAIRVAVKDILSGAEKEAYRFRAGFVGNGMTDKERLRLLKTVELSIKEPFNVEGVSDKWSVKDIGSDDDFANQFFTEWCKDMIKEANKKFIRIENSRVIYQRLLWADNPVPLAKAIRNWDNDPCRNNYARLSEILDNNA